jgi:hypothetical protein
MQNGRGKLRKPVDTVVIVVDKKSKCAAMRNR